MGFKEMQKEVDDFISAHGGYWPPLSMLARLMEEAGELAREMNHVFGMKKRKPEEKIKSIEGEMGDIIFNLACMANHMGIDLDEAFRKTMDKARARDTDRVKDIEEKPEDMG